MRLSIKRRMLLERNKEKFVSFLRPRRFGKSLFVSALACYYGILSTRQNLLIHKISVILLPKNFVKALWNSLYNNIIQMMFSKK
jgi:hypothetical protein